MHKFEIESIADLVSACGQLSKLFKSHHSDIWYRGIRDESMRLIPGIIWRGINPTTEQSITAEFHQYYSSYSGKSEPSPLKLYTIMQHYGLPTRLLDWSLSPLIALYFALEQESKEDENPIVWAISPTVLNHNSLDYNAVLAPNDFRGSKVDLYLPSYFTDSESNIPENVISIYAPINNPRVRAQKGCFTLHGFNSDPIDEIYKKQSPNSIAKITLKKKELRPRVINELYALGIKEDDVYQDLNSLSKRILREFDI